MNLHANHRTCPSSRRLICRRVLEEQWTLQEAAAAAGCSTRTAAKWLRRFHDGDQQLLDRSSRPRRSAYAEVMDDLTAVCAIAFLRRAVRWFSERGVQIKEVMTDNGSCYVAHAYAAALRELGLRQLRIRPGRPQTNGKVERLIQTLLNEWAYARIYGSSVERAAALPSYLRRYNFTRPHGSLGKRAPATRVNNLLGNNT